jgi:2-methylisocitrate lyase-like PEP mutase family enzyme
MSQAEKASLFNDLHVKGDPVILYNAWDAGSARAILGAGAKAIATSSYSVAEAHGYRDGEAIPADFVQAIVGRIVATVDAPVTVDFEGGYSDDDGELAANVSRLLDLGVVGVNFEDRVVNGQGLYAVDRQARRIGAIRAAADKQGVPLFVNARTDLFLGRGGGPASEVGAAIERGAAYAAAGASGFFIPGLADAALIGRICESVALPVNVMVMDGVPSLDRLKQLGVSRVSYGPIPYVHAMAAIGEGAAKVYA